MTKKDQSVSNKKKGGKMPLVRILKYTGFEQVGDIVDWRGNLEEALANGTVELLSADPRPAVTSTSVTPESQKSEEQASITPVEATTPEVVKSEPSVVNQVVNKAEELLQKVEEEVKQVEAAVEGK